MPGRPAGSQGTDSDTTTNATTSTNTNTTTNTNTNPTNNPNLMLACFLAMQATMRRDQDEGSG